MKMNKKRKVMAMVYILIILVGCISIPPTLNLTPSPIPFSSPTNKNTTSTVLMTTQTPSQYPTSTTIISTDHPSTLIPSPTSTISNTPPFALSLSSLNINIDSFACSATMSINLLLSREQSGESFNEVLCWELGAIMNSSDENLNDVPISNWFINSVGSFLSNNDLPISIYLEQSLNHEKLLDNLSAGKLPIAVVNSDGFWHAIVIVGFDANNRGYIYLDSLDVKENGLPDENDFFKKYGVEFIDAWRFSFIFDNE